MYHWDALVAAVRTNERRKGWVRRTDGKKRLLRISQEPEEKTRTFFAPRFVTVSDTRAVTVPGTRV